jgi:hypothetical protein
MREVLLRASGWARCVRPPSVLPPSRWQLRSMLGYLSTSCIVSVPFLLAPKHLGGAYLTSNSAMYNSCSVQYGPNIVTFERRGRSRWLTEVHAAVLTEFGPHHVLFFEAPCGEASNDCGGDCRASKRQFFLFAFHPCPVWKCRVTDRRQGPKAVSAA